MQQLNRQREVIVEFFSEAISVSVWRYRSVILIGSVAMT